MFFHLPNPIGWIALDPHELQKARERARAELHLFPEARECNERHLDHAPLLLTAEDAARALGVETSWLLREARKGSLPHVRLGKYIRFDPREVIGQCTRTSKSCG
jgi:excisionase family DNA binding protein